MCPVDNFTRSDETSDSSESETMFIITAPLNVNDLKTMAEKMFGTIVKAVVDVDRRIIAIDAELHSDEEGLLLENGSRQEHLWGINLLPEFDKESVDFIEFDSMINLRPSQGNKTRGVDDPDVQKVIISIVNEWIR